MDVQTDDATTENQSGAETADQETLRIEYAGFWIRFLAFVLDSLVFSMVLTPLLLVFYDVDDLVFAQSLGTAYYVITYGLPFVAFVIFWKYRGATPGKIWMDIYIVDADTLGPPSVGMLVVRYLGYYVSIFTLFLGFIWIAFDPRKQGFHDKMAHTVVIKNTSVIPEQWREKIVNTAGVSDQENGDMGPGYENEGAGGVSGTSGQKDPWKE